MAKGTRVSHTGTEQEYELLERISADIIGPLPESVHGYKYILNIIEHNTNYGFVKILRNKNETSGAVIEFINRYENKTKKKLKTLNVFKEIYGDNINEKLISTKWIFTRKEDGRYKARLVARGFEENEKELDIYAPVACSDILRLFLSFVAKDNLFLDQIDSILVYIRI